MEIACPNRLLKSQTNVTITVHVINIINYLEN